MDPLNELCSNNEACSRYNLFSLALFISVAETGSIAATASRHNIAASAVSRRMGELEALIETTLLYRQQRGVELTSAGKEFYRHSQNVFQYIHKMQKSMEEFSNGIRGVIRIAANTSSITQFLPDDIAAFTRDHPAIQVKLVEMYSTEVVTSVRSGEADFGLCSGSTDTFDCDRTLYRRDTLVLATPKDHHLATRDSVTLKDILKEDIVSLQNGSAIQALVGTQADQVGYPMKTKIEVMSFDGVRRMVEVGLGVAILPFGALEDSNLAMVPINEPWALRDLIVVTKPGVELGRAAQAMLNCLLGGDDFV